MKDLLVNIPLFDGLSEEEKQSLASRFIQRFFPKNTMVVLDGEESSSMYVIIEGRAKVFAADESGREVILGYLGPNEYFGEMSLIDGSPRSASVMTLSPSKIAKLSRKDFMACLSQYPQIVFVITQQMSKRMRTLTDRVKNLSLMDVYGRLAAALTDMAEPMDGKLVINERLTHQDLASLVGSSREMISKILKELKIGGYLSVEAKRIVIEKNLPQNW